MRGRKKQVKILFVLKNSRPVTIYICSFSSSSPYTQENSRFQDKSCFWIAAQTNRFVFEYKVLRILVTPFVAWFIPVFSLKLFQCLDSGIRDIKPLLIPSSLREHGRWKKKTKENKSSFPCHQ